MTMQTISIAEGNKIIAEYEGRAPEIEYWVAHPTEDSICYSPKNVGGYFRTPYEQKRECDRWLAEQKKDFPQGWVTKGGYVTKEKTWWPRYDEDWNLIIKVIDDIYYSRRFNTGVQSSEISSKPVRLYANIKAGLLNLSIRQTREAVIHFIQWYNENK